MAMFTAASVPRKVSAAPDRHHRPRTPRKLSNALQTLNEVHKDGTVIAPSAIHEFLLHQQLEHEQIKNMWVYTFLFHISMLFIFNKSDDFFKRNIWPEVRDQSRGLSKYVSLDFL